MAFRTRTLMFGAAMGALIAGSCRGSEPSGAPSDAGADSADGGGSGPPDSGPEADGGGCRPAPSGSLSAVAGAADAGPVNVPPPSVTIETYPKVDGSTSTIPIARLVACTLLGVPWKWAEAEDPESSELIHVIVPDPGTPAESDLASKIYEKTTHTKTHSAYTRLIDGEVDLILVASEPSSEERAHAAESCVTLDWRPVALDALVFLVNGQNPIQALTTAQIRSIYTGESTRWSAVGGADEPINPYSRPENSGSQELMQALVMGDLTMPTWPPDRVSYFMGGLVDEIRQDPLSIGYSVYYFVTFQYGRLGVSIASVDGVLPNPRTISTRSYPHVAPVLVVTRADLDRRSSAYQMRDWLLAPNGQTLVAKTGYVPVALGDPGLGRNLDGAALSDEDFVGADLAWSTLHRADLTRANLTRADLTGSDLSEVRAVDARIDEASLSVAFLERADFTRASLRDDIIVSADLSSANLAGATLTDADLKNTDLTGARLAAADLSGADMWSANLAGADLTGLRAARIQSCPGVIDPPWQCTGHVLIGPTASLAGATVSWSWITDSNLRDVDLRDADLTGTYLTGSDLTGSDLSDATLRWLAAASLLGCPKAMPAAYRCMAQPDGKYVILGPWVDAGYANLSGMDLQNLDLTEVYLGGANLSGANLTSANLTNANLREANMTGAIVTNVIWSHTTCVDGTLSDGNGLTCAGHL